MDGVVLEFDDDAIEEIANLAIEQKTGARGLRAIMEHTMMDTMYSIPSNPKARRCRITKSAVEGTEEPEVSEK